MMKKSKQIVLDSYNKATVDDYKYLLHSVKANFIKKNEVHYTE